MLASNIRTLPHGNGVTLPPPNLRTGVKAEIRSRILHAELTDEQALIAVSLLALGTDDAVAISSWVAVQMFDCTPDEWWAYIEALVGCGLVEVTERTPERVWLRWRSDAYL